MQAIRQFQEERNQWEAERESLERRERQLVEQKDELSGTVVRLNEELEQLRRLAQEPVDCSTFLARYDVPEDEAGDLCASVPKLDFTQIMKFSARYPNKNQIPSSCQTSTRELDFTTRVLKASERQGNKAGSPMKDILDITVNGGAKDSSGGLKLGAFESVEDALLMTQRGLQWKHGEVLSLEGETLKLREELNAEKEKVVELKRREANRRAEWKEELEKISAEVAQKHRLDEENTLLRATQSRLQEELAMATEREAKTRQVLQDRANRLEREAEHLREQAQAEAKSRGAMDGRAEELEIVTDTVGRQLVAVEQELTRQVHGTSRLLELFLQHSVNPVDTVRRSCKNIALRGEAGPDAASLKTPPMFERNSNDLRTNLVKMVDVLRFAAEILERKEGLMRLESTGVDEPRFDMAAHCSSARTYRRATTLKA